VIGSAAAAWAIATLLAVVLVAIPALRAPLTRAASGPRWRADAVPVSGGIAMAIAFAVVALVAAGHERGIVSLVVGATFLGAVGVIDDLHPLPPAVKLVAQAVAGLMVAAGGVRPDLPGGVAVETAACVAWVVIVSNAVNLLDGMDGLAGGIGLLAGAALWMWDAPSRVVAAFVGAVAGFLPLNLRPARMFMGNGGSHWMGVVLAGLTIMDGGRAGGEHTAVWSVIAVPVVLLAVPVFDTVFVVVERIRRGRPVTQGGTDHTSHRLVSSGMSEPVAVAVMWALGLAAAGAATAVRAGPWAFFAATCALGAALASLALRLRRVDPS
jgi:UDP-GlcNAc:undecaprenyl-phosphate GlcNAc-1-phosphate transferase